MEIVLSLSQQFGEISPRKPKFCVADFATLSDERRSRSKILYHLIWITEPCVRKVEGLTRLKVLGILQTIMYVLK